MIINLSLFGRIIVILLICFFSINVFAQQKPNYSLLWKITGKGITKPSYLFGTMHVKDKRVFNFSDSVMLALSSSSRFAMEVHPDTLMIKMFQSLQSNDSLRSADKLLSKEQYEALAKKFRTKNGYDMDKTDPLILESLMNPNDNKTDDKVSFVDAYLYGIARTLNKNISGLEDAASQFDQYYGSKDAIKERLLELLDDDIEQAKDESKEEMIKIYSTGDLDEIYKYAKDKGAIDSTIAARNKVMAASMIKYMLDESLFTAVGAAHLPGPGGVIALLRNAGYTVTKVKASFTGVADTYHIDYMKMNWPAHRDEDKGYSVNFPGAPIKFNVSGVNTLIYPDLANDFYYSIYTLQRGTQDKPANRTEVVNKFLSTVAKAKNNHILSRKDFVFNKLPCTEVLVKTSSGYLRMRVILTNNMLYNFYAGSRVNKVNTPNANRFLNSFISFPVAPKIPASWITYNNPTGAFTVKLPLQPQAIIKEVPSKTQTRVITFKLNMYLSTDTINSKSYLLRYNDYPTGTYLNDKDALFNTLINEFKGKGKVISDPVKIVKDGIEGREIKVILTGGFYTTIRLYVRGNRTYLLLKEIIQPDLKDDMQDAFFDSFHFTPYIQPDYYTFKPDSGNYKLLMVSKPMLLPDSSKTKDYTNYIKNANTYYSTNPNSGGLFGFEHSTISPYFRIKNTDSLYKRLAKGLVTYQDSLLRIDTVLVDNIKGLDILTQKKGTDIKRRARLLINGREVFYFIGHMDNSEFFDKTNNTFLNSLTTARLASKIDLSISKADKIFHDLGASDTTIYNNALGALSYYDFSADEYPAVYEALQKSYPDDSLETGIRATLIKKFTDVHNDTVARFMVSLYPKLQGKDMLKAAILNVITTIDKKKEYDTYLKLLTTDPPINLKESYLAFAPLNDSLEFAAAHFEQILPLIKYDNLRKYILRAAQQMANEKDGPYVSKLNTNYSSLMAYAKVDIDNYLLLRDSTNSRFNAVIYNYMQVMAKVKNKDLNDKLTAGYLDKDPKGAYAPAAVIARISNNLPNNALLVNKLLDSIDNRYDIMEAFNKQNQLSGVPVKYRTQAEFAKLCLYQSISQDDYGSPEKITLLGSIIKKGVIYYVFKYLLPQREEKKELIGITGPYKPGSTKLNFKRYYASTNYEVVKINWRLQGAKMIEPLLKAYK